MILWICGFSQNWEYDVFKKYNLYTKERIDFVTDSLVKDYETSEARLVWLKSMVDRLDTLMLLTDTSDHGWDAETKIYEEWKRDKEIKSDMTYADTHPEELLQAQINRLWAANPVPDTVMGMAGTNCEGLEGNFNPLTEGLMKTHYRSQVMRMPSGAGIKFMHLDKDIVGSNRDSLQIVRTFDTLEIDENGTGAIEARESILNEWRKDKLMVKSTLVIMADAALVNNSPVIWVANIFNGTSEETIAQLDYLFSRGVNVVGVELGNECHAWYSNTFEWYESAFKPHLVAVHNKYPQLLNSLVSGHMNRNSHNEWNDKLALYIRDHNSEFGNTLRATVHTYEKCATDLTKYVLIAGQLNSALNTKMIAAAECLMASTLLVDEVNRAKVKYGVPIWCTEWNSKPYDPIVNSLVNGAWMLKQYYELTAVCEYTTNHNGVSSSWAGNIFKANDKFDVPDVSHFMRSGGWSLSLYLKYPSAKAWKAGSGDGVYYYSNLTSSPVTVQNSIVECIDGDYSYSSAGATGYMEKGSTRQYELDGIKTFSNILPAYSYGIITIGTPHCDTLTFWRDADGDGFGELGDVQQGCDILPGYVLNDLDCDDQDATTFPGNLESCNGMDDNCDGLSDEGLPTFSYWSDFDLDGFGEKVSSPYSFCALIEGYSLNNLDCNDANPTINPMAIEGCGTVDFNCDGIVVACPPETCLKKSVFYFINKRCVKTEDLNKCNCPK